MKIRDRPFNLKEGGLWFFVSFRIFFSDNTELEFFFFLSHQVQICFPGFNVRLYDKNSESHYFFFPPPKSEYFFQQHWESEYFFFFLLDMLKMFKSPLTCGAREINIIRNKLKERYTKIWREKINLVKENPATNRNENRLQSAFGIVV